ncbi:MAG: hypothetical protein HYU74_03475 [Dechloromonas sp.]|nr:hypothetical protein [Dechloromonas sp.]
MLRSPLALPSAIIARQPAAVGQASAAALAVPWWLLALLALGASTLCAVVLVVARTPFLGFGAGFFRTALVLHVDLAVVVWFLAVAAGLWLLAIPVSCCVLARLARAGVWLAGAGVLAMLLSPFAAGAVPVLANYVPVLDSPSFYLGLAAFLAGVGMAGMAALASLAGNGFAATDESDRGFWRWAVAAAILAFWGAIVVFLLALRGAGDEVSLDGRLWGGGHVLQIVHTLMLMAAWLYLGREALGQVALRRGWIVALIGCELLAVLADLAIALAFPVDSLVYRRGFTEVMRWATWPAPVGLAGCLLVGYRRLARASRLKLLDCCLIGSIALFVLGCLVGAGIRGETTAVPAHYHGTVGAVTLAYMVWARSGLERLGMSLHQSWLWRSQPMIYGAGISLMVLGLAWAGRLGVPRKAPHVDTAVIDGAHHVAMGLAGIGGLLATAGAGIFVLSILMAIRKRRND